MRTDLRRKSTKLPRLSRYNEREYQRGGTVWNIGFAYVCLLVGVPLALIAIAAFAVSRLS